MLYLCRRVYNALSVIDYYGHEQWDVDLCHRSKELTQVFDIKISTFSYCIRLELLVWNVL